MLIDRLKERKEGIMAEHYETIVIGAGMAGLAAARALHDATTRVVVLEAKPTIGGRSRTDYTLGSPLETGASWLHGLDGHPLRAIADSLGLDTVITDYEDAELLNPGGSIDTTDWSLYEAYVRDVYKASAAAGPNKSVAQAAATVSVEAHPLVNQATRDLLLKLYIDEDYAADSVDLSAAAMEEGEDFQGPDALIRKGYSNIVQALAKDLDIRTDCAVHHIDYSDTLPIVRFGEERLCADQVLITVPLGVLKTDAIGFFPVLPENKQQAVKQLGMGLLNKLYLRFDEPFWPADLQIFALRQTEPGPWASWFNLTFLTGKPILMGFNAGHEAAKLETLSDQETVASAMAELRAQFRANLPDPEDYLISRWGQDPFALGAYSYLPAGADADLRADLSQCVDGKLYFAGEATHRDFPACTQGAYFSGLEQAEIILSVRGSGPTRD